MWSRPSNTEIKVIDHDKCDTCEHFWHQGACVVCNDVQPAPIPAGPEVVTREFFGPIITANAMLRSVGRVIDPHGNVQKFGRAFRRGHKP